MKFPGMVEIPGCWIHKNEQNYTVWKQWRKLDDSYIPSTGNYSKHHVFFIVSWLHNFAHSYVSSIHKIWQFLEVKCTEETYNFCCVRNFIANTVVFAMKFLMHKQTMHKQTISLNIMVFTTAQAIDKFVPFAFASVPHSFLVLIGGSMKSFITQWFPYNYLIGSTADFILPFFSQRYLSHSLIITINAALPHASTSIIHDALITLHTTT